MTKPRSACQAVLSAALALHRALDSTDPGWDQACDRAEAALAKAVTRYRRNRLPEGLTIAERTLLDAGVALARAIQAGDDAAALDAEDALQDAGDRVERERGV